jgi:hypothetical protein
VCLISPSSPSSSSSATVAPVLVAGTRRETLDHHEPAKLALTWPVCDRVAVGRTHRVEEITREESLKHTEAFRLAHGKTVRRGRAGDRR